MPPDSFSSVSQLIDRLGWFLAVWLLAMGGAIGSFLNVVVYRLPAGKSLVRPGSRCPVCGHPIRWYHNLPVVSWLWLRGKCRDCGVPIAARYPLVELTVGLLFVGLAAVEVWPATQSGLIVHTVGPAGPEVPEQLDGAELLARYGYHLWLLCTLLAAALIERDGQSVPRRMLWLAVAVGLIGAAACPATQPRWCRVLPAAWSIENHWSALASSIAGGVAGWSIGGLFGLIVGPRVGQINATNATSGGRQPNPLAIGCVGVYFGWQGAVLIGIVGTLVWLVFDKPPQAALSKRARKAEKLAGPTRRWGPSALLFVASAGWLVMIRGWFDHAPPRLP